MFCSEFHSEAHRGHGQMCTVSVGVRMLLDSTRAWHRSGLGVGEARHPQMLQSVDVGLVDNAGPLYSKILKA